MGVSGDLDAHVLDLAVYEVGNVLVPALEWDATDVAAQLDDLLTIVGAPIVMTADWRRNAATLAQAHTLLVSADRRLLAAGLRVAPRRS